MIDPNACAKQKQNRNTLEWKTCPKMSFEAIDVKTVDGSSVPARESQDGSVSEKKHSPFVKSDFEAEPDGCKAVRMRREP